MRWKYNTKDTERSYSTWYGMIARCYNPSCAGYKNYGARGINVCSRWLKSYDAFYEDMGLRPKGMTIERIDNNKGYSPENCRWATRKEQSRNRRGNVFSVIHGESKILAECAEITGFSKSAIGYRVRKGIPVDSPKKRADIGEHGTRAKYSNGCRCESCKQAGKEYRAKTREKHRVYEANYRERKRAAVGGLK